MSNGTDALVYDSKTTFTRALPAVASGQYVPPPFVTIVSRTFDDKNNLVAEFSTTQTIPQYVQITWTTDTVEAFRQPLVFNYVGIEGDTLPSTNVTIFAGCSTSNATAVFSGIIAQVQDLFPVSANIIVVGPDVDVPQPHKTAVINAGKYNGLYPDLYGEALGLTPNTNCHERNDSPSGSSDVYNGTIREYILNWYNAFYIDPDIKSYNDWRNVPLPFSADLMTVILSQTALHEICHTMGLVPAASAVGGGHNNCQDGSHYMDDGSLKRPLMRLGFDLWHIQRWMPENRNYLQFVFPQAY